MYLRGLQVCPQENEVATHRPWGSLREDTCTPASRTQRLCADAAAAALASQPRHGGRRYDGGLQRVRAGVEAAIMAGVSQEDVCDQFPSHQRVRAWTAGCATARMLQFRA